MADLAQLSTAAAEALRDAEVHKAQTAAHFLRCQIHELFREARHAGHPQRCTECEFHPPTAPSTNRFHNGG